MTLLVDTSGFLVYLDADARDHERCAATVESEDELVLSPFVLAEAGYLVTTRHGGHLAARLLGDVAAGAYTLAAFAAEDVAAALEVLERFSDLSVGLADASLVVLANRYGTGKVLTYDERHFRALRWGSRRAFTILPRDA